MRTQDPRLHAAAFDVSDAGRHAGLRRRRRESARRAHVVINNAGIEGAAKPVWATGLDTYARVMQVNSHRSRERHKSFLPQLLANGEGAIVNVSSVFGLIAPPNHTELLPQQVRRPRFTQALMVELRDTRVASISSTPAGSPPTSPALPPPSLSEPRYLSTPPERIVEHVIRGIGRKQAKIVYGKDSFKTLLGAHLLPLKPSQPADLARYGRRDRPLRLPAPAMTGALPSTRIVPLSGHGRKMSSPTVVDVCSPASKMAAS